MLADSYFERRERLAGVVSELAEIARDAGLNPARKVLLENLFAQLQEPVVILAGGSLGAGKSTLLRALFGEPFSEPRTVANRSAVRLFRHDRSARDETISEVMETHYRPADILRRFRIVYAPSAELVGDDQLAVLGQFVPSADVLLVTLSIADPWNEAGWKFLRQLASGDGPVPVIVLQQKDRRSSGEVDAIGEHVRRVARKRLAMDAPVFAVAARMAITAAEGETTDAAMRAQSGVPQLEDFLGKAAARSPRRDARLRETVESARKVCAEAVAKAGKPRPGKAAAEDVARAARSAAAAAEAEARSVVREAIGGAEAPAEAAAEAFRSQPRLGPEATAAASRAAADAAGEILRQALADAREAVAAARAKLPSEKPSVGKGERNSRRRRQTRPSSPRNDKSAASDDEPIEPLDVGAVVTEWLDALDPALASRTARHAFRRTRIALLSLGAVATAAGAAIAISGNVQLGSLLAILGACVVAGAMVAGRRVMRRARDSFADRVARSGADLARKLEKILAPLIDADLRKLREAADRLAAAAESPRRDPFPAAERLSALCADLKRVASDLGLSSLDFGRAQP